jgi:lipopolysaccharide biosynthesis regulator YciM
MELYRNKNFVQASLYFEKAAKAEIDLATATFYNGMSSLYSGHYTRAISLLQSQTISASRYARQAEWYLSLAYFKSDQKNKAINMLKEISRSPHHYKHGAAIHLLEALE